MVLLLMLALAACGGEEPGATGVQSTEVAAAPTTEEAADDPQAAPTEAEPAGDPTDEPTAAPTDEPAPEPTDEPTAEPTDEPVAAALPEGECGNAFFPVIDGRTLTYSTNVAVDGSSGQMSISYADVTDSSFTYITQVDDLTFETVWQCSEDGLLSPEASQLPEQLKGMTVEFVEAEGVSIPAEERFREGELWSSHYTANATISMEGMGSVETVQTYDIDNIVYRVEPVSVPAGDFPEAYRVDSIAQITSTVMGQTGPSFDLLWISWYVEGIGMVRQQISGLGVTEDVVMELISID